MATLTERIALIIDATGVGAIGEFKKVGASATKELGAVDKATAGTRNETGLLSKGLDRLGLSSISSGAALKAGLGAGAAAAGIALVKFAKDGIDAYVRLGSEVKGLQRVTGAAAQDASGLNAVLKATGTDTAVAERGFFLLSKTIENTPAKLAKVGVEIARNKDGNVNLTATLGSVAEAYQKAGKGAEGNAVAAAAFGKAGAALLPVLGKTKEELAAIIKLAGSRGLILDQAGVDAAIKYKIAMRDLGESVKGLEVQFGKALAPALSSAAKGFTSFLDGTNKVTHGIGGVSGTLEVLAQTFTPLSDIVAVNDIAHRRFAKGLTEAIPLVGPFAQHLFRIGEGHKKAADEGGRQALTESDLTKLVEDGGKAAEAAAGALDKLNAARLSAPGAALSYEQSLVSLQQQEDSVRDAQRALTDAVKAHGATSEEARTASLQLQSAQLGLKGDLLGVASAAAQVAEKQALAAGKTFGAKDAAQAQIDALSLLQAKFPQLTPQIQAYIFELDKIPGTIYTDLTLRKQGQSYGRDSGGHVNKATADGGIFSGPEVRLIGEAGPEAVIPLSASKRSRAKQLMGQAGIAGWANGGIAGVGSFSSTTGGMTFNINVSASGDAEGRSAAAAIVDALTTHFRRGGAKPDWAA